MLSSLLAVKAIDRRFLRYFLIFLLVMACAVGSTFLVKAWRARSKRLALYAAAQTLFDADYYRTTYALRALSDQAAFQHYMAKGYEDLRNPSADFDATFYERLYLTDYTGKAQGAYQNPLLHYVRCGKGRGALTHPKFIKKAVPLVNPKYYLCVTAIFRDEARFLKEWIEYYLMMGVEHFYLTNHLSKDNYMEVLQPYIDRGLVTLREETEEKKSEQHRFDIQNRAYFEAMDYGVQHIEWLLIVDTDEFLVPYEKATIADFLRDYEDCAAVAFHWKNFGMNGVAKLAPHQLLIEEMTHSSKSLDTRNAGIKTAFRPRYCDMVESKKFLRLHHRPLLKKHFVTVDVLRNPLPFHKDGSPVSAHLPIPKGLARLYHYRFRDRYFLENVKLKWQFQAGWIKNLLQKEGSWNVELDTTMMRFVPEMKRRMGFD